MEIKFGIGDHVHARVMTLKEVRGPDGKVVFAPNGIDLVKEEVVHREFDGQVLEISVTAERTSYKCSHDDSDRSGPVWVDEQSLTAG